MKQSINFDKIYLSIQDAILSSNFYFQSISILSCFVLSYICYKLSRSYIFPKLVSKTLKKNTELNLLVTRYLLPLLYTFYSLIFLSIGLSIYSKFFNQTIVFSTVLQLTTLFLFLQFLRISSNNSYFQL
jgi:hypothetical protein